MHLYRSPNPFRRRVFSLTTILVLALIGAGATPAHSDELSKNSTIAEKKMRLVKTITGNIAPKSVRASGFDLVSAHNMMYRHSVTLYDSAKMELVATVSDQVDLKDFGFAKYASPVKGSPVEGAYSPDGKFLYVSNYAMYGKGFTKEGTDTCSPSDGYDKSFVYRINTETFKIDAVYPVGSVPKVVEVTPDGRLLLVSNWCSYDLTVISLESGAKVKQISIGAYPRGITISPDSRFAYVAQMGGSVVHQIDLADFSRKRLAIGSNPRALQLSSDGKTLYATLNASGQVVALDIDSGKVIKRVTTGKAARSLVLTDDESALIVVNYFSDTVAKVRVSDFKVMQKIKVCDEPIGITFDGAHDRTWVACYGGAIKIYQHS
jgi:YVTN family beta-propeller protein